MNHSPEQRFHDALDGFHAKPGASPDPHFVVQLESQLQRQLTQKPMKNFFQRFLLRPAMPVTVAAVVLLAVVGVIVWQNQNPTGIKGPLFHKLLIQGAQAQEHFVLTPTESDSFGVTTSTKFRLTSKTEVNCDDVADSLALTPDVAVAVKTISATECELTPSKALDAATLYRIALGATIQTDEGESKHLFQWAYQTKDDLHITTTIPRHKAAGVPIDTGIDITFNTDRVTSFDPYFSIAPATKGRFEKHGRTWSFVPAERLKNGTLYTVTIKQGVPVKDSSVTLASTSTLQFETAANYDNSSQYVPPFSEAFTAVQPDEAPVINVGYFTAPSDVKATVYEFNDADELLERFAVVDALPSWAYYARQNANIATDGLSKLGEFPLTLDGEALKFPTGFDGGYYLIEITIGNTLLQTPLVVSNLSASLTLTETNAVLWLYDLANNKPLNRASVTTTLNEEETQSDSRGIAQLATPSQLLPAENELSISRAYFRVQSADGRETLVPAVPAIPWNFGGTIIGGVSRKSDDYWTYLWTDRTLYRPNDTLNLWGVLKDRENPTKDQALSFEVWTYSFVDANGNYVPVAEGSATTNDYGSYQASLPLTALKPGYYVLGVKIDGRLVANRSFEVHTFQKPAYQIVASANAVAIIDGDSVRYDVQTQFFDGTPAPHIHLRYGGGGHAGDAGTDVTTDEAGKASFTTTPRYGSGDPRYARSEQLVFFPADSAEGDISATTNVMILPSAVTFDPSVKQNGHDATLSLTVTNVDLSHVVTPWESYGYGISPYVEKQLLGTPAPKTAIDGTVYEWVTTRTKTGTRYDFLEKKVIDIYRYETRNVQRETFTGVTDDQGVFTRTFTLPGDTYFIDIAAKDSKGRKIVRTAWVDTGVRPTGSDQGTVYSVSDEKNPNGNGYDDASAQTVKYGIGDTTTIRFMKNGETVIDAGEFLFLKLQNGVKDLTVADTAELPVTFGEEDAPNIYYSAIWFQNGQFYAPTYSYNLPRLVFNQETRRLTVDVTPEKSSYGPGDTATLNIHVKDADGKPARAMVNVSAIDEALTVLQWDNPPIPLESLYVPVSMGLLQQYVSHSPLALESAAEGGGGGDGERRNFRDAPLFTQVETGSNGNASVSFTVPDNITSWRITTQAVTKDLHAGQVVVGLPVTKPLFGVLTMNDQYVVDDKPVFLAHAYGTGLSDGHDVTMTLEIPTLDIKEERSVKAFTQERFGINTLEAGDHEVKLTVLRGNLKDVLVRSISVLPSRLTKLSSTSEELHPGATFTNPTTSRSALVFTDTGRGRILTTLETLQWSYGKRLDRSLAARIATDTMKELELVNRGNTGQEFHPENFQQDDGGISLVSYGSSDLRLTAFAAGRHDLFDAARLREYFSAALTKKDASLEQIGYALYGLAQLGEPVLPDLESYLALEDIGDEHRLTAALAFQALGANDEAYSIARSLLDQYGETQDPYIRLTLGASSDAKIVHTAEIAILAEGLKLDERTGLNVFLELNFPKNTITNLERALAMRAAVPTLDDVDASFRYRLNGKETTVDLKENRIHPLSLSPQELADLAILEVKGPVGVVHSYLEPLDTNTEHRDAHLSINRTYALYGASGRAIQEGDIVRITLTPKVTKGVLDSSFLVVDTLPSGLVLLSSSWERGIAFGQDQGYPIEADGQRITFYTNGNKAFYYYARVLTPGIFSAEPAVLQGENSRDVVNYSGGQSLEIR